MRRLSSRNWHGNVTIFLRGRHLFVTPGCNADRKNRFNKMKGQKTYDIHSSASSSALPVLRVSFSVIGVRIGECHRDGASEITRVHRLR